MKPVIGLLFLFLLLEGHTQKLVKGIILDTDNNPVPKASVFLSNTSIGTTANNEGRFQLTIPAGKFDLIVSSIGYITYNQQIASNEAVDFLTIRLKVIAPEMEAVVIEPYEKDGWEKWGKWFIDNFLGTSAYSRESRIKNTDVLKFKNSRINNELTVIAKAPLVIENKSLGYRMTYQLENFHYDFKTRYIFFAGYPFFENMEGTDRKQRQWQKARKDVYNGSMLQFMRALYRNKIKQEGFEVRRLQKIPNAEKQRVKMVYKNSIKPDEKGRMVSHINQDSAAYYEHVMSQDDYKNVVGKDILPGDSIAYGIDTTVAGLGFENYLLVIYKNKKVPAEFRQLFPKSGDAMMSEITLINNRPIEIFANGSYFNPEDLLSSGYWGWWEKIGTMLPFDYVPSSDNE